MPTLCFAGFSPLHQIFHSSNYGNRQKIFQTSVVRGWMKFQRNQSEFTFPKTVVVGNRPNNSAKILSTLLPRSVLFTLPPFTQNSHPGLHVVAIISMTKPSMFSITCMKNRLVTVSIAVVMLLLKIDSIVHRKLSLKAPNNDV